MKKCNNIIALITILNDFMLSDDDYLKIYHAHKEQINNNYLYSNILDGNSIFENVHKIIIHENKIYFQNYYGYITPINEIYEVIIFFKIIKYYNLLDFTNFKNSLSYLKDHCNKKSFLNDYQIIDFNNFEFILHKLVISLELNSLFITIN